MSSRSPRKKIMKNMEIKPMQLILNTAVFKVQFSKKLAVDNCNTICIMRECEDRSLHRSATLACDRRQCEMDSS